MHMMTFVQRTSPFFTNVIEISWKWLEYPIFLGIKAHRGYNGGG